MSTGCGIATSSASKRLFPPASQVPHWTLIDAGPSNTLLLGRHASALVAAVRRRLQAGDGTQGDHAPPSLGLVIRTLLSLVTCTQIM